ncbi:MAG: alpha/beta hydrolase family protein, partial [Pseudomonas sp.]|uniref:alpha/beta hydrolase family protein n=1 Tax=Pseudomonas sp. TaxID=306 RepID=UPI003BB6B55F
AATLPAETATPDAAAAAPATETATDTSTQRPEVAERSQGEALALQEQLPAGEQQQLNAGAESFLALWQPANKGDAQGLVILLPGAGESADWPQTIGPLRSKLPDAGWHSLSLTLPDPQPAATAAASASDTGVDAETTPTAEPAATPGASATTAEASPADSVPPSDSSTVAETPAQNPEQHAERVLARIQAGIEFAQQQKPKSIVLLGHGTGGYWAARYLSEHPTSPIQNLLLVAPLLPEQFSPSLDELVPKLQLAVGDFYYKNQQLERTAALKRMQASKRQKSPAYIQVAMSALPGNPTTEQEQLYRRIRGWLSLHLQAEGAAPSP